MPLDSTCFHSLKPFWNKACDDYMGCHPEKVITIYQFSMLFASAAFKAFAPRNITATLWATEVSPPNRWVIPIHSCKGSAEAGDPHLLPHSSPCSKELSQVPSYTVAETKHFQVRFEEVYDLTHDEKVQSVVANPSSHFCARG